MNLVLWLTSILFAARSTSRGTSTSSSGDTTTTSSSSSTWLRIIQINDVYELDCFPSLKTLVDTKRNEPQQQQQQPDETLVVCCGDFLAPSLLSSLDQGASMVDCLNQVGVTHVCLGNHEADVSTAALKDRILQSKFVWINSNLPELGSKLGLLEQQQLLPEYCIVQVGNNQQNSPKKVALLGLLTHDPTLYRPGAFLDAPIQPTVPCAKGWVDQLHRSSSSGAVDLILPLTHQSIQEDRDFCQAFSTADDYTFPVVCGGHDHEIFDETHAGSRILKAGMDATHAAIIDIRWNDNNNNNNNRNAPPTVEAEIIPTRDFGPDPDLQQRIQGHQQILRELEGARLFRIPDWIPQSSSSRSRNDDPGKDEQQQAAVGCFSTLNNRLGPSTGTTALCTMLRMGMRAQCAMINAGAVRGNQVYYDSDNNHDKNNNNNQEYFTWSDLKAEVPFPTGMTACYIPGRVLEATIAYSRRKSRQSPPEASGGYLHTCRNLQFNDETGRIESIGGGGNGKSFDPNQEYLTALPAQFFAGMDNHKPLLDWAAEQQQQQQQKQQQQVGGASATGDEGRASSLFSSSEESAIPAKMVLVQVFSALLWLQLGSFADIDRDRDGVLRLDEVKARVLELYGHESVADLVVQSIFAVADMNGSGFIEPLEMMIVQFAATDCIDHVCSAEELHTMKEVAARVLGAHPSHEDVQRMVERIRGTIDLEGDGKIHRAEVMKALGHLKREDLLK